MKQAFTSLLIAALLTTASHQTSAQAVDNKPETTVSQPNPAFAALEGAWVYEKIISAGQTVPKEKFPFEIHFKSPNQMIRKAITVGQVTGKDGVDLVVLDSSKQPSHMDMSQTVQGKTQKVLALYKLEADLLTICFSRGAGGKPSSERPTGFESDAATKSDILVLKRKVKASE